MKFRNHIKSVKLIVLLSLMVLCAVVPGYAQNASAWRFAVICDTRGDNNDTPGKSCINDFILGTIAKSVANDDVQLVIFPGDLVNGWASPGGTPYAKQFENWKAAMAPIYSKNINVYTVRGNHEFGPYKGDVRPVPYPYPLERNVDLVKAYDDAFGKDNPQNGPAGEIGLTYYFSHKNAFFVAFDQLENFYKNNQPWFDEVLEKKFNKKETPHIFTYGHMPAFSIGHNDCLATYPEDRDKFWNSFGKAGGKIYFCGHDHLYNRAGIKDSNGNEIFQVLSGSCGAPNSSWTAPYKDSRAHGYFHNESKYGYMLVTIDGKKVSVEWKAWDVNGDFKWVVLDKFAYTVN